MRDLQKQTMFALHILVGNAIFYVINSLFLGPLVVFIDKPVPEGKKIAADMSFTAQAGNAIMIIYMLYPKRPIPPLSPTMVFITLTATSAALALATAWQQVTADRSIVLWIVAAIAGSLGCFGNVMGWCWAAKKGDAMMSALSAGMGAGALIPSIISLIMNPGTSHQQFSVAQFYWIATAFMVLAVMAVLVLDYSSWFPRTLDDKSEKSDDTVPLLDNENSVNKDYTTPTGLEAAPTRSGRGRLMLHMAVVCWCASMIFGWQPGLVPYLIPNGHPLVVFQIAGQVADVVGRLIAPAHWLVDKELYAGALQTVLFIVMNVLAAVCNQHSHAYQVGMTALNTLFALSYGIASTRIMMTAARFIPCLTTPSGQLPDDAEDRVVQTLGAALSFGSGIGGMGCYFLVQQWLAKVDPDS
eukprot:TRINITY_DN9797_c0_g1_i1.p1 TRINITY_DN9797_c0_g1~~TRINITY_DN9797_c0_g1_i1.p1  ORF type:complete len:413 (+),score=72.50 TRINITY_DN9797_c0_g1_i1:1317-2555(+)